MVDADFSAAPFERSPRPGDEPVDPVIRSFVNALEQPLAVLDGSGTILAVNPAWRDGSAAGRGAATCPEGENYLDWCASQADDAASARLLKGVRRVLRGLLPAYAQAARLAWNGAPGDLWVRIRRLSNRTRDLYLVSHESAAAAADAFEDRLLAAQIEERERLAADLHDSVGQDLVCLGLGLTRLRSLVPLFPEIEAVAADMSEALDHAYAEIRTLSFLLQPPWLEERGTFVAALRDLALGFGRRAGLRVAVELADAPPDLGRARELTLFRIVQEALVNVHRHAQADAIEVALTRRGDQVVLRVRDNGRGMLAREGVVTHGAGLVSMRARLGKLGGDLRVLSGQDGTTLIALVPV